MDLIPGQTELNFEALNTTLVHGSRGAAESVLLSTIARLRDT